MAYQYQPLPDPSEFVRVAVIQPGSYDDPIRLTFKTRCLKNSVPAYEALSYAWGSHEDPSLVYVDIPGQPTISVTRNLDIALRRYRLEKENRTIWIDALCIDQASSDPREKSKQVSIMGRIFSSAYKVLAWLGPVQNRSDEAMELLENMGRSIEVVDWGEVTMQPHPQCDASDKHFADIACPLPFRCGELEPVLSLFRLAYFNRVWIRQELALSSYGTISCGDYTMNLDVFRRAIICVRFKGSSYEAFGPNPEQSLQEFWKLRRLIYSACCLRRGTYKLENLQFDLNTGVCQDPRDKIFAVLELLQKSDRNLGIEPDYSLTTELLYAKVARRFMTQNRSLKLLDSCTLAYRTLNIPSWIPDWSAAPPFRNLRTKWSACGWISPNWSILSDTQVRVSGVMITQIECCMDLSAELTSGRALAFNGVSKLKPSAGKLQGSTHDIGYFAKRLVRDIFDDWSSDTYLLRSTSLRRSTAYTQVLERIWEMDCPDLTVFESIFDTTGRDRSSLDVLGTIELALQGTTLCWCTNGSIGQSYLGVEKGDAVAILPGCRFPVILRPVQSTTGNQTQTWKVVSIAKVTGLMRGEAIYGKNMPAHWRTVAHYEHGETDCNSIDGKMRGMYDPESNILRTDPGRILEEMGIKVESYGRNPHHLVVLPETLRAAGIPLQDFILV
ncbi:heterokaryon incompatibility protein-domain-containing protein [Paraphoma chrysanthemicola]|uniref:Heterokaryon incompatibility protein-domain-containing protein n=1 Tax=Paraphoma chrysanthemicola TaxID=798071 RepID=A0A8K0VXE1_9PLEO|nr:heterokaryon incompatibility protein-domain-containing protein [Paraphoma chrysanthemicola]